MAAGKAKINIKEEYSVLPNNIIKEINTSISNFIAPQVIKRTMCTYKRFDDLQLQKLEDYLELTARANARYFEIYESYFTEMHYKQFNLKAEGISAGKPTEEFEYKKDLLQRGIKLKPKSEYVDLLDHIVKYPLTDKPYPAPKRGNSVKKEKAKREPKPKIVNTNINNKTITPKTVSSTKLSSSSYKKPKISYPKGGGNNNNYSWDKKPNLGLNHLDDGGKIDNNSSYVAPKVVKEVKRKSTKSFVDTNSNDSKRPNLK